ncbi:MAG: hypothetical protein ABJA79_10450, partial [Parafilimonas sp.]
CYCNEKPKSHPPNNFSISPTLKFFSLSLKTGNGFLRITCMGFSGKSSSGLSGSHLKMSFGEQPNVHECDATEA